MLTGVFRRLVTVISLTTLISCAAPETTTAPAAATNVDVSSFAKDLLNELQPQSYTQSREYCGYILRLPSGALTTTRPRPGTADSCQYDIAPSSTVASFHTHGGYLPRYFNELPSVTDVRSALAFGQDDYVGTPGGRLWQIDGDTGVSTLICGRGCLDSDPNFVATAKDPDQNSYTLEALEDFQRSPF